MSEQQLFIPKRIVAGFQDRQDTYQKKLAYVIYYDDKGVLRKEKSWESWRDKKIEPEAFDNTPQSGFVLNKNVERYRWSHFSSGRSYIRIYDSRGIEFEITPENLIGILMNGDCSRRVLDGEFVYAWSGKDLILLPVNSEEYQKSLEYSKLQGSSVKAKQLIPGASYKTKKQIDLIYLGKFDWFEQVKEGNDPKSKWSGYGEYIRESKKMFVFYDGKGLVALPSIQSLASVNTEVPVSNYAELMDVFQNDLHSADYVKWEMVKAENVDTTPLYPQWINDGRLHNSSYFIKTAQPDMFMAVKLTRVPVYIHKHNVYGGVSDYTYSLERSGKMVKIDKMTWEYERDNFYNRDKIHSNMDVESVNRLQLYRLHRHLTNGTVIEDKTDDLYYS